jgi:hypothetical protein
LVQASIAIRLEREPSMSTIAATQGASQISPANERVYRQSNLQGDWKGSWTKNHRPVELKVVSIKGNTAQVEYTHDGHTERGAGTVNGSTITFGNVTIGTRDGKKAALEFSFGTAKMGAILDKAAAPADQNKLVGNWIGSSATTGQTATFQVLSISGRNALIRYTVNGQSAQGVGDVYKNTVTFGKVQVTSNDGSTGTVIFPVGRNTLSLSVTKFTPNSSASSVNKLV